MNNLTLLIDFNWLLMSRMSVLIKGFEKSNPEIVKEQTSKELEDLLAKSINVTLNRFKCIDNIVIVSDGGSWRKQLPIPKSLKDITYKGNRSQAYELDWNYIYGASNNVFNRCKDLGITCTQHFNIEGDDWIWYWSRRLNMDGVNTIIWSSDNDLKQLVQVDKNTQKFTVWYNDKAGLFLPSELDQPFDEYEFFMRFEYSSPVLESIKSSLKNKFNYINPNDIVLSKVLCGDAGDNIKSIVRYTKNNRTYRFSEKDYESLVKELNIKTINDLLESKQKVSKYIISHKKFMPYKFDEETVNEMFDYNVKLVWLNENTIPESLISSMNQYEYKLYDLSYIRDNYKVLCGEDDEIKNIFESF